MTAHDTSSRHAAHFIDGERRSEPAARQTRSNKAPAGGAGGSVVPLDDLTAADSAVAAAARAFGAWSATPVGDRVQPLFRFKTLLESHADELAALLVRDHGKTRGEALGSVRRGIDCVEFACGAPALLMGRTLPQIAVSTSFCRTEDQGGVGIDSSVDRVPVGVCVGITPFNFPVMVPLWMWPMAVACGNTFVLKPSEKDPLPTLAVTELAHQAGLPRGVLNMVNGGVPVVNRLITHPEVAAISFVGSTRAGEHIYKTGAAHGKRVQCMCGAKNHSVVMPDANRAAAIEGITGSAFGNTGQRCLAGSVVVCVGDSGGWLVDGVRQAAAAMKVDRGDAAGCAMGPLVDQEALGRTRAFIDSGLADGARLVLDGRQANMPSQGCFIGPTIFDHCAAGMSIVDEEIFGPVLSVIRVGTLAEAIAAINRSRYGNMAVIFTSSGHDAHMFRTQAQAGMLGVNVGVPAPMAAFPFAGWKQSFLGDLHANGEDGVRFFTRQKVTVTRWL